MNRLNKNYDKDTLVNNHWDGEYIRTPFARDIKSDQHHALNYLIQSTAADLALEQAVKIRDLIRGRKTKIAFIIHDSVVLDFCSEDKELFNTLMDGEHIIHNKRGEFINLFAAFDIYFVKGTDVRNFNFINEVSKPSGDSKSVARLPMLNNIVRGLDIKSVIKGSPNNFRLEPKQFQYGNGELIFNACGKILERVNDGLFEYETDGLIFTPASFGVGVDKEGETPNNFKTTWKHSFKWKPAQYNTIDFLVSTQKTEAGDDAVKNIYQDGQNVTQQTNIKQFKTLVLRVGFDEKKHGYLNFCLIIKF